jgi:hypothetical protein
VVAAGVGAAVSDERFVVREQSESMKQRASKLATKNAARERNFENDQEKQNCETVKL